MRVYTPLNIDIFKEEYHLNEQQNESLDEARDMMKYKPTKQSIAINQLKQYEQNRIEFDSYYYKWLYETCILSDINKIFENLNFKSIVNMGKRAVPFIYEKIKEEPGFIVCALSEIYGYSLAKQLGYKSYLGPSKLCELWIEKLNKDGIL